MSKLPPRKTSFLDRREREFLYLEEVDALIAATQHTRSPIRNSAIALLLFCQALQPTELGWLRWSDVNFAEKTLSVMRNRSLTAANHPQQVVVNRQPLCPPEIELLQQLREQRTTEWIFASERKQRLSQRSLHHLIQQAGELQADYSCTSVYVTPEWALLSRCTTGATIWLNVAPVLFTLELSNKEDFLV